MDRQLLQLAKELATAMVAYHQTPQGNVNRVPAERREALKNIEDARRALSTRAEQVAKQG